MLIKNSIYLYGATYFSKNHLHNDMWLPKNVVMFHDQYTWMLSDKIKNHI